jgi:uncharacterized protein
MGIFDFLRKNKNIEDDNGLNEIYHNNGKGEIKFLYYKKNGKIEGVSKSYYENGNLREETNYKNGLEDGKSRGFWESDGLLCWEKNYRLGKWDGILRNYHSDGSLSKERKYKDGEVLYKKCFDSNGNEIEDPANYTYGPERKSFGEIIDSITQEKSQTKEVKLYHDNGQLRTEATLDSNGKPHGNCKEWYPNGNIYKDQNFKHGVPHGSMKEYFDNGNIRQEYNFKNGQHHGISNEFYEDGSKNIIATFKDGKEHGMKEQYYPSGNLETRTTYVDGMIEGVYIYLKEDGEVIEEKIMQKGLDITAELMQLMIKNNSEHMLKSGLLKDGAQDKGELLQNIYEYYKSNNLKVESAQVSALNQLYKDGKIDKEFYDISMAGLGQVKKSDEWYASRGITGADVANSPLVGQKYYYENGQVSGEGNFKNDKKEGVWKSYYENGQLKLEENFSEGKREGVSKLYHSTGELKSEVNWRKDKMHGVRAYEKNGEISHESPDFPKKNNKE